MKQLTSKSSNLNQNLAYSLILLLSINLIDNSELQAAPAAKIAVPDPKAAKPAVAAPAPKAPAPALDPKKTGVVEDVTSLDQFNTLAKDPSRPVTVAKFHMKGCGHCVKMAPVFENLAKKHKDLKFIAVSSNDNPDITQKYNLTGFPMFRLFNPGEDTVAGQVDGADEDALFTLVEKYSQFKPNPAELEARRWTKIENRLNGIEQRFNGLIQAFQQLHQDVQKLKENNGQAGTNKPFAPAVEAEDPNIIEIKGQDQLDNLVKGNNVVIELYSPTCGACKAFKEEYSNIAKANSSNAKVKFAKASYNEAQPIFEKTGVSSVPTILIFRKGSSAPDTERFVGIESDTKAKLETILKSLS